MTEIIESPLNGRIKVKSFLGRFSVWVGGYEQSGPLVKKVWEKALKAVTLSPRLVLILGLGCGVAAKLISEKYPKAKITGVEIDPQMIDIGRRHFSLGGIPNLKVICADAKDFFRNNKVKYDLVLVDAYIGNSAADFSKANLPLTKTGLAVFNVLKDNKNTVSVVKLGSQNAKLPHKFS